MKRLAKIILCLGFITFLGNCSGKSELHKELLGLLSGTKEEITQKIADLRKEEKDQGNSFTKTKELKALEDEIKVIFFSEAFPPVAKKTEKNSLDENLDYYLIERIPMLKGGNEVESAGHYSKNAKYYSFEEAFKGKDGKWSLSPIKDSDINALDVISDDRERNTHRLHSVQAKADAYINSIKASE